MWEWGLHLQKHNIMRTVITLGAAFLIGRWLYLNMKEKVKIVEIKVHEVKEKIVEVATDSWRS